MIGDLRDHRHLRSGARQNRRIDLLHVGSGQPDQPVDAGGRLFIFQSDDDAQIPRSLSRLTGPTIKRARADGKPSDGSEPIVEELLRTNDLVLISVVEAILARSGMRAFVADAHASVMDGSLGMLPRRVLIASAHVQAARAALIEEGLGAELSGAAERRA